MTTDSLGVWLFGRRAGTLERSSPSEIRYTPSLDEPLTVASSGLAPWPVELTRNWFDGLLPEGDRRTRVAARFGLRPEDTFGLLAEIGWECAGAVAVLPDGRSPADGTYQVIDDAGVGERLDDLPSRAIHPYPETRTAGLARFGGRGGVGSRSSPSCHRVVRGDGCRRSGVSTCDHRQALRPRVSRRSRHSSPSGGPLPSPGATTRRKICATPASRRGSFPGPAGADPGSARDGPAARTSQAPQADHGVDRDAKRRRSCQEPVVSSDDNSVRLSPIYDVAPTTAFCRARPRSVCRSVVSPI